jgi:protein gp37
VPEKLAEPFHWSGPRTVFVNSMSDLFQPEVPDAYIQNVVKVMVEANWHTYQVLTKRSERLRDLLSTKLHFAADERHIWWGVSVEDKKYGLPRIKHLRAAPAAVKFLSIEPLLQDLGEFDLSGIDWAMVGGESGHGARPMEVAWVEKILKLCRKADVAFFSSGN